MFKFWLGIPGFLLAFAGLLPHALGGDILRGGAGANSAAGRRSAEARANSGAAAAQAARVRAQDQLARTTKTVNDMRALQTAARRSAGGNSVPNGLGTGGLDLDRIVRGASNPMQAGNTVTIRQNESQALLEWKSFNVGRDTTLKFDQSAGGVDASKWVAFNRVTGSTAPSQILGRINADGQVYVLNQNGIIFGAGSQVNARALVASTLPINENLIQRGLLNNPDAQFLFSASALDAGTKGPTPAFTPSAPTLADGSFGDIVVERGATITSPTNSEKVGGRVTLVGANVRNEGSISTPDGQTIMAAGLQVGFAAHPTSDPTLRGLDVYLGNVDYAPGGAQASAGTVLNAGLVEAPRGSIAMAGKTVRQLGVLESSTSTALNGRVDLLANYGAVTNSNHDFSKPDTSPLFYNTKSGLVELGAESLVRILPDFGGKDRAVGTTLALPSIVNIQGRSVHLASKATIQAPGASIPTGNGAVIPRDGSRDENRGRLDAGVGIKAGEWISTGLSSLWANSSGQVYLDSGALIDVAGTVDVPIPMSHNILTLQLRGAELANSPVQREGVVRGASITLDARRKGVWNGFSWIGTPLGDVSAYLGIIERTVAELTTPGGSVSISAGESLVMQPGSLIDVSGGTKIHAEGRVRTTRLRSNGQLIDIADATPDRIYDSIYNPKSTAVHLKWGVTKTYYSSLALRGDYFQKSYVEGADAGSISLTAPSMALDGRLVGRAVQGPRQVNQKTFSPSQNGSLALRFQKADSLAPQFLVSPTPPAIRFSPASSLAPVAAFALDADGNALPLRPERKSDLVLSPALLEEEGFGTLLVDNSDGDITIPLGTPLSAPSGGAITLKAANLAIDSEVSAPGGSLDFTVYNISRFFAARSQSASIKPPTPSPKLDRGVFSLGAGGILRTAGLLVDNRPGVSSEIGLPPVVNGGSVSITAYTARLASGSLVDVSGGLSIRADGKRTYGNGGSISILAGRDPSLNWVLGGEIELGAALRGHSRTKGGSLALQAPLVRIGAGEGLATGVKPGEALNLDSEFFNRGGFSSFSLTGLGKAVNAASGEFLPAISIAPGTLIRPVVESVVSARVRGAETLQTITLPEGIRPPVDLAFLAPVTQDIWSTPSLNLLRGDIVMGAGSRIETDALAKVTLRGGTVSVLGSIVAPGGQITIAGASKFPLYSPSVPGDGENNARPTVFLGPSSIVSTVGKFVRSPDVYQWQLGRERQLGTVVPGGSIVVDGNIVAAKGAVLDVSGSSQTIEVHPSRLVSNANSSVPRTVNTAAVPYGLQTVPVQVDSDAGTLSLLGREMLFADATLRGFAGGPSAAGGSLVVSSGRYSDPKTPTPSSPLDVNLVVSQSGSHIPDGYLASGATAIGRSVPVGDGDRGRFSVGRFADGGFDSLKLSGTAAGAVGFSGDVSIMARRALSVAEGGVLRADANVLLQAPYVSLGTAFQTPVQIATSDADRLSLTGKVYVMPTEGTGVLTVRASLIDIGNLSLQNIGLANFIAENGDIRGNGALNIAGTLNLRAGQIYPTTAGLFNIVAYDPSGAPGTGRIEISAAGVRPVPYSAGGTLGLYASTIVQGGTVRAPFGTINIGWDGTGSTPKDYLSGAGFTSGRTVPVAQEITLSAGSLTSVSGGEFTVPFGYNSTPQTWMDPAALDVTGSGLATKAVNISGLTISGREGAVVDVAGGGDLLSYRWVTGNGGSKDILAESGGSFAIIPGYGFDYSPYAAFNGGASNPGYTDSRLAVGDRIYLGPGSAVPAGSYTLLPARYALLPGAVLVTPKKFTTPSKFEQTDGSTLVAGYRTNSLNPSQTIPALASLFEVAPAAVFRQRAEYEVYSANTFFPDAAQRLELEPQRIPKDSGRALVSGLNALRFDGYIQGRSLTGGFGAQIDLSTRANIVIGKTGSAVPAGTTLLDSAKLSSFGADSLLIGGIRSQETGGTRIAVATKAITVDNAGSPLAGSEILLASSEKMEIKQGSSIVQSGSTRAVSLQQTPSILVGTPTTVGSGNGLLLRVSDQDATIVRSGVSTQAAQAALPTPPAMIVGSGVTVSGSAITLDSTFSTSFDSSARLLGKSIGLNSGQIALAFDNPGAVPSIAGLVLSGAALNALRDTEKLSLLSYSSLDLYGSGSFGTQGSLALNAAQFRGFNNAGASLSLASNEILIGNASGASALAAPPASDANLILNASNIRLLKGSLLIGGFGTVAVNAPSGLRAEGDGSLDVAGALTIATPAATASGAVYAFSSTGSMALNALGTSSNLAPGLGSSLSFTGGTGLAVNTNISLPSGSISLRSVLGDLRVGNISAALLDAGGTKKTFNDISRYTDGGKIELSSGSGSILVGVEGRLNVAAQSGGGSAGSVSVKADSGSFQLGGVLSGSAGTGGASGLFSLDVGSLALLAPVDQILNAASFFESRQYRIRSGDVAINGFAKSRNYLVSADGGSITVGSAAFIDASGATGGNIRLVASGSVVIENNAKLSVAAQDFNAAGKGGKITLEAGSAINGVADTINAFVDIRTGSTLDLRVASNTSDSAGLGRFTGTLHLRAPQNTAATNLNIRPLGGSILGASSILAEGFRVFDLTGTGTITSAVQTNVRNNGNTFGANIAAISSALLAPNPSLEPVLVVAPGAEIVNRTGSLILGTSTSTTTSDWNLSGFRYGPKSAPGVLTLRARDNLVLFNALSDGFTPNVASTNGKWLYAAPLSNFNTALPSNLQSWSYRMAAGADLSSADFQFLQSLDSLGANAGLVQLGKLVTTNNGLPVATGGANAQTSAAIGNKFYQTIRTGSGDITIAAGRDVQFLNQFATIYSAGTRLADPTLGGLFETPPVSFIGSQGNLGAAQQNPTYPAQYSLGGGDVSISAQRDIARFTQTGGVLVADSQKQIPNNWLYRRGYVDPQTGRFGVTRDGDIASTTWWVDFSNFFQGVGALGGGQVALRAGRDVANVDAVVPTNARVTHTTPGGDMLAANQQLVELGGGDVFVSAGRNLDAGIYYVERGAGRLQAGGSIITNPTRLAALGDYNNNALNSTAAETQWLPTTLFIGKGSFDVAAAGDITLGPTVNPFLLPAGVNNSFWRKSYFSTYSPSAAVRVSSLGGDITLRQNSAMPGSEVDQPILQNWMGAHLLTSSPSSLSLVQPWLRLAETQIIPFQTAFSLLPPTLTASAIEGSINLSGTFNLFPAAAGTIELAAAGSINGLQPRGTVTETATGNEPLTVWSASSINLSDARPSSVPGILSPFGFGAEAQSETVPGFLQSLDNLFAESGSSTGLQSVVQTQQTLHGNSLLRASDPDPLRIYAGAGSISGFSLFSGKFARIAASQDISDIALYLQNNRATDMSIVSSGRDIVPYNANTPSRTATRAAGNKISGNQPALAGDIQINGPGTLAVLAGRDLDLGLGSNNADGTGVGIASIGNARNPNLPFQGADIIAAAGVGPATALSRALPFDSFIQRFVKGEKGAAWLSELSEKSTNLPANLTPASFDALDPETKARVALEVFYLVLRDSGRAKTETGDDSYSEGFEAIDLLFAGTSSSGDIQTRSRDIRTRSGGSISLLAPGGSLELATSTIGLTLTPPGIVTEAGGAISIFTDGDVDIGISRIFTLRGGDQVIWSTTGDIAAGSSAKTVQSAPPTRVLIDPQSAALKVDLGGLATGGGIGVLASVEGVKPGNVDLIAPGGTVDAGDAGIRSTGNLNIAATKVLNADNISTGGTSAGVPTAPTVAAPNIGGLTAGSNTVAATNTAAESMANQSRPAAESLPEQPSLITVEILGYGGGDGENDEG
ncbi:MAG: filamentous hemagglutinin family protein [bacterium]